MKMSNIAKEAGLAHGTVYIYFKNKRDLINQLFKKAKRRATKTIGVYDQLSGNFFDELKQFWAAYLTYLFNNQKETHFIKQCVASPFLEQTSLELSDSSKQQFIIFFEKGKNRRILYVSNKRLKRHSRISNGIISFCVLSSSQVGKAAREQRGMGVGNGIGH